METVGALVQEEKRSISIEGFGAKVVFITGGSLGIGREACYIFAREGWSVVFCYHEHEREAKEVERKCLELGAKEVLVLKMDVRDRRDALKGVKEIVKKFGGIDVLVNNAGVITWKNLLEQEDEEIEDQMRTNLEGLIFVTKYCLPYVRSVIVNVASGAGKTGYADLTTYCATKFGVRGFTQALANEVSGEVNKYKEKIEGLGPESHEGDRRLRIYCVNPGMTSTRMTNFSGVDPLEVANIIFDAVLGKFNIENGGDIDVWEHL